MALLDMTVTLGALVAALSLLSSSAATFPWQRPGCHLVGYDVDIKEFGCLTVRVGVKACRGFCESFSVPLPLSYRVLFPNQDVLSRGRCCSMQSSEDITVQLNCWDGVRTRTLRTARSCGCSMCRTDY